MTRVEKGKVVQRTLVRKSLRKSLFSRPRRRRMDGMKVGLTEMDCVV
jgi:hypothetical protein